MKKFITLLFFLNCLSAFPQAIIKINEIQSNNGSTFSDEDGDYEDWIELYNAGTSSINLLNYSLTDNINTPNKWKFPSVVLQPGGYLLVFASGKDRKFYFDHWEMPVRCTQIWKYQVGNANIPSNWNTVGYNDNSWTSAMGSIGYGDDDDSVVISPCISIYMRKTFSISDTSKIYKAIFSIDYDDSFVAYINGVEIARSNINGNPPLWDATSITDYEAQMYKGGKPTNYTLEWGTLKNILKNGLNVLAVQVHNRSINSSDMTAAPFLSFAIKDQSNLFGITDSLPYWFSSKPAFLHTNFKIDNDGEEIRLFNPNNISVDNKFSGIQFVNTSIARKPDGSNNWCMTTPPTPKQSNGTTNCYTGICDKPQFSLTPGFYNAPQYVTITNSLPNTTIRYTLNGNKPTINDKVYTGPVLIDSTRVLKARVFSTDGTLMAGSINTATYFINETFTLPVVSFTMDSMDLWDWNTGIYVLGPNANLNHQAFRGANFWMDWERESTLEYYDNSGARQFSVEGLNGIFGNYSRAKPQKSFDFKVKSLYDTLDIDYQIFPNRNHTEFKNLIFRNAGSDWMKSHLKDEYLHELLDKNGLYCNPNRPVIGFLNGKYWGVYYIREKSDEKFLERYSGYDKDSIDQIRNAGNDWAANGDMTSFNSMVSFFSNSDLSSTSAYNIAKSYFDMDNYMTYFAAEMYSGNDDWVGNTWSNNIKMWKPRILGAKWKYQLHDIDQGLIGYNLNTNSLALAINPLEGGNNNHSMMLSKFIQNSQFKIDFVNRYADLLNTVFKPDTMLKLLNKYRNNLSPEMQRAYKNFLPAKDTNEWINYLNDVTNFINQRPAIVRNHIRNYFNLLGDVNITIDAAQPNMGKVKINSVKPDSLPWTGIYFNGNPVTITAIAEPGYMFDYWEPNLAYPTNNYNMTIVQNFAQNDIARAHFKLAPSIAVTEINFKSDPTRNSSDWIEFYNYGSTPITMSNWKIQVSSTGQTYTIPSGTTLNANSYFVFVQDTNIFRSQYGYVPNKRGHTYLNFNDNTDEIYLMNNFNNVVYRVYYSDTGKWPECASGLGRTLQIKNHLSNPNISSSWTCGCMGGSPGTGVLPCNENIIFSEINYNPRNDTINPDDWVELLNKGNAPVDISGWVFKDGLDEHSFTIPDGTILNPNQRLVLSSDLLNFNLTYDIFNITNVIGDVPFKLDGNKEAIRIYNKQGKLYYSMVYHDNYPWPVGADGNGYTLELLQPDANPNEGTSWFAGCFLGSPGSAYVNPCNLFAINDLDNEIYFKIYPNPSKNILYIESNVLKNNGTIFKLFDLQGRQIIEIPVNQNIVSTDISKLQNGIYIYKIIDNKLKTETGKIIKY